jgi:hypothetical protein
MITEMPGLVQNWPAPMVSDPAHPLAIASPRALTASGSRNIGLTEPSSPKNGIGSGRWAQRSYSARPPASEPVKPTALISGCWTRRLADIALAALDQREDAGMHAELLECRVDRLSDDLAGARMGGMALDHDRAAGGKCCRGVAAGGGEGQREVRRAEHGHRADRALEHAQVRTRQRRAIWQRLVMAAVEIIALLDMAGEQPQLPGGAAALAFRRASGRPVSEVPMAVISAPRASISSAIALSSAARSAREE